MRKCGCHSHGGFLLAPPEPRSEGAICNGVDGTGASPYLDLVGSVSALVEVEDDFEYDPNHIELNHRLIHNGS